MPGQDVDDPAFAANVERHLRCDLSSLQRSGERTRHRFVQSRMTRVQESIELAALPADDEIDMAAERSNDMDNIVDTHSVDPAGFYVRDHAP